MTKPKAWAGSPAGRSMKRSGTRQGFADFVGGVIASDWVKDELTRAVFVALLGISCCFWFGLGHPRCYRGRFFSRVRLQRPHDQTADQIADGHAAERSFDGELRDHVLCERQFGRSFLAPVPHADGEACHVRGFRWLRWRRRHRLKLRLNPVVDAWPPQADAQARARNLQRANGDADQFGDFLAALAVLDQILDLLDALGRELDLTHFSFLLFCVPSRGALAVPLLRRFSGRAGLVTSRQTFVRDRKSVV